MGVTNMGNVVNLAKEISQKVHRSNLVAVISYTKRQIREIEGVFPTLSSILKYFTVATFYQEIDSERYLKSSIKELTNMIENLIAEMKTKMDDELKLKTANQGLRIIIRKINIISKSIHSQVDSRVETLKNIIEILTNSEFICSHHKLSLGIIFTTLEQIDHSKEALNNTIQALNNLHTDCGTNCFSIIRLFLLGDSIKLKHFLDDNAIIDQIQRKLAGISIKLEIHF